MPRKDESNNLSRSRSDSHRSSLGKKHDESRHSISSERRHSRESVEDSSSELLKRREEKRQRENNGKVNSVSSRSTPVERKRRTEADIIKWRIEKDTSLLNCSSRGPRRSSSDSVSSRSTPVERKRRTEADIIKRRVEKDTSLPDSSRSQGLRRSCSDGDSTKNKRKPSCEIERLEREAGKIQRRKDRAHEEYQVALRDYENYKREESIIQDQLRSLRKEEQY